MAIRICDRAGVAVVNRRTLRLENTVFLTEAGSLPILIPRCASVFRLGRGLNWGQVAQLVEQRTENPCVGGSTPPLPIA